GIERRVEYVGAIIPRHTRIVRELLRETEWVPDDVDRRAILDSAGLAELQRLALSYLAVELYQRPIGAGRRVTKIDQIDELVNVLTLEARGNGAVLQAITENGVIRR